MICWQITPVSQLWILQITSGQWRFTQSLKAMLPSPPTWTTQSLIGSIAVSLRGFTNHWLFSMRNMKQDWPISMPRLTHSIPYNMWIICLLLAWICLTGTYKNTQIGLTTVIYPHPRTEKYHHRKSWGGLRPPMTYHSQHASLLPGIFWDTSAEISVRCRLIV